MNSPMLRIKLLAQKNRPNITNAIGLYIGFKRPQPQSEREKKQRDRKTWRWFEIGSGKHRFRCRRHWFKRKKKEVSVLTTLRNTTIGKTRLRSNDTLFSPTNVHQLLCCCRHLDFRPSSSSPTTYSLSSISS